MRAQIETIRTCLLKRFHLQIHFIQFKRFWRFQVLHAITKHDAHAYFE